MRTADDHRCNRRSPWRSCELLFLLVAFLTIPAAVRPAPVGNGGSGGPKVSWTSDNGNGTFTNPLFYDEFSDPDIIRVGSDYYLTGTTMHVMPGLPVLHSKDLVNWEFLSYAVDRLDFGADYRLQGGKDAYGSGIWAPALRYHAGSYYIFANVNGHGTQVFRAKDPHGPWKQTSLGATLHDLSVLFDEDGRVYAVYGYGNVHLVELKPDLSGVMPDTDRIIIHEGSGVGEGHHFYKIQGKYVIISADYAPVGRMTASRADHIDGPYDTVVISARETMGFKKGWSAQAARNRPAPAPGEPVQLHAPNANEFGAVPLHQGGIVDLPNGDWWGWSMMDAGAMGRTTFLSPVTWSDGWPYFGLPNNLGRSPRTWLKPATGASSPAVPTYRRDDDFSRSSLQPIWQWNHVPVDRKWSLLEKAGALRLHTLPAPHFLAARNTLTQRAIGPISVASVKLDARRLEEGDVAGLGLLAIPYYWLGVTRAGQDYRLRFYDELADRTVDHPLISTTIFLRVEADYDSERAQFSYSEDGRTFLPIGDKVQLAFQLKTFQGVRYSLFAYNTDGREGGAADFDSFTVREPLADRSRDIPLGKIIVMRNRANGLAAWADPHGMLYYAEAGSRQEQGNGARFRVVDRGNGRVALEALDGSGFLTVVGQGLSADVHLSKTETKDSLFQWQDLLRRDFMLLSLRTHRYLGLDPLTGEPYSADWPGTRPDREGGTVFHWEEIDPAA